MSAFGKDVSRSIRHSLGRFIALAAIAALGCGFYAGLRMTAPDMNLAADEYYDGTHLMDVRVVSTFGLTDEDIEAIGEVDGVEGVMPSYETDVLGTLQGEQYTLRVHSLSGSAKNSVASDDSTIVSDDVNYLNRLHLVEGRWPERSGECVIFNDRVMSGPSEIGDVITLDESVGDAGDTLTCTQFTIVGKVHSPLYVSSTSMGTTTIGTGSIEQFMYILPSDFADDIPYVSAYVSVSGASELESGSDAYDARVREVVSGVEGIAGAREQARVADLQQSARDELEEERAEYEKKKEKTTFKLAKARDELDETKKKLDKNQSTLNKTASTLSSSETEITEGNKDYTQGTEALSQKKKEAQEQFDEAEATIAENEKNLEEAKQSLPGMQESLESVKAALAGGGLSAEQRASLEQQQSQLEASIKEMDDAEAELEKSKEELAAQKTETGEQFSAAQKELDDSKKKLDAAQKELDEGKAEYEKAKKKLASAQEKYEKAKSDYDDQATKANDSFDEAEAEFADAEREIDDMEPPEWLVMDRSKNYGVTSFENDAARIDAIASVFPFIFFLVAALVALTTMTRMVEEERVLIGTYKALGYSRARITSKYLIYAFLASAIGAVVGIAVLSQVLPWVIMTAYAIIYYVPQTALPIDWFCAATSAGLGVGIILVATWAAAYATLRESPAALMLPPAPKAGKRILLERVRPVWRHLSFSWKVTMRNLFRYKKRLVMTVIGIAGCTALLLTGLGLENSINDIIDVHYGEIADYNVIVTSSQDADEEQTAEVDELLRPGAVVESSARASEKTLVAQGVDGTEAVTTVIAPQDVDAFESLWHLRERVGHEPITLSDAGVVVSEKLANKLGLALGDYIVFAEQDDLGNATNTTYEMLIVGIAENYISDYAFTTSLAYRHIFGEKPDNATILAKVSDDAQTQATFSEQLRATGAVDTVSYTSAVVESYRQMLSSVDMVVVVLVVAAAALAFIVLYNLTNINIAERSREIATLKVLGFTPREVNSYIFREILLLAIMGALLGLLFGVALEGFVVVTAEVDYVMFGRSIHAMSFVLAFVLTLVFTLVVMLFMRPKLAKIDMVESLKSNE